MFQDKILVEVLLVHLVDLWGVHKVDNLADTIDRLAIVDPNTISHPGPCSRLRLSEGCKGERTRVPAFTKIRKPRCSIVFDQGCTGDLALGKVFATNGFVNNRGLAVELSVAFFLFFELADLAVLFLLALRLHLHWRGGPFTFRRIGLVLR